MKIGVVVAAGCVRRGQLLVLLVLEAGRGEFGPGARRCALVTDVRVGGHCLLLHLLRMRAARVDLCAVARDVSLLLFARHLGGRCRGWLGRSSRGATAKQRRWLLLLHRILLTLLQSRYHGCHHGGCRIFLWLAARLGPRRGCG